MADKEEEKSEWDELVPLDGLDFDGGKKEEVSYDNGPQVPIEDWDKAKIDPEEYKKPKSVKDSLLKALREGRLEAEYNARKGELERKLISPEADQQGVRKRLRGEMDDLEAAYKEVKDPKKTRLCASCGRNIAEELGKYPNLTQCPHCGGNISRKKGIWKYAIIALLLAFGIVSYKMYDKKNADLQAQLADKDKQIETLKKQESAASKYNVGDIIEFGSYPYEANGTEKPIEWQILEKYADGTALVISKYGIDSVKYNEINMDVTWETSTLRKWLNNDFYNKAFKMRHKNRILTSYVINDDDDSVHRKSGNNTRDKMFLLSVKEVYKYFDSYGKKRLRATPYAKTKSYWNRNDVSCTWWLRAVSDVRDWVAIAVNKDGLLYDGIRVDAELAIRPAMKINLKNL